jgi:outer membrane protein assembly factor BamB
MIMKRKSVSFISLVILSLLVGAHSVYGAEPSLLWEITITAPDPYTAISGKAAVYSNSVIFSGQYTMPGIAPNPPTVISFFKVYDISTGNLKWERTQSAVEYVIQYCFQLFDGNIIYVWNNFSAPSTVSPPSIPLTYGAYNIDNGQILWEKTIDSGSILTLSKNMLPPLPDNKLIIMTRPSDQPSLNFKVYQVASMSLSAINYLMLDE